MCNALVNDENDARKLSIELEHRRNILFLDIEREKGILFLKTTLSCTVCHGGYGYCDALVIPWVVCLGSV